MTPDHHISHLGTKTTAAKAIGFGQSTISEWKTAGHIPLESQIKIELITRGALKADLPKSLRSAA
jgi:hypothetical protein